MRQVVLERAGALPRVVRFGLAGGLAAAVNWLVRFVFSAFMPFLPAVVAAALVGMLVGFIAYRSFVFVGSSRPIPEQVRDFLLVNAVSLLCVAVTAIWICDALTPFVGLTLAEAIGHAIAIGIGAVINFVGHGAVTFQTSGRPPV